MRDIRVASVQFQHAPGDKTYNLGRVRHYVNDAARAGAKIVVFPEMCLTGYWHVRKPSPGGKILVVQGMWCAAACHVQKPSGDVEGALRPRDPAGPLTQELLQRRVGYR